MPQPDSGAHEKRIRRLLIAGAVTSVLLITLIAATPTLLSGEIGRSILVGVLKERVRGEVTVGELDLSWSGPQSVRALVISSTEAGSIELSASVATSAWELLRGESAPIQIDCSGAVRTTYDQEGAMAIARLFRAEDDGSEDESAALPEQLRNFTLVLKDFVLEATAQSPAQGNSGLMALRGIGGTLAISGGNAAINLKGSSVVNDLGGSFAVDIEAKGVIGPSGEFRSSGASLNASISAEALPLPARGAPVDVRDLVVRASSSDLTQSLDLQVAAQIGSSTEVPATVAATVNVSQPASLWGEGDRSKLAVAGTASLQNIPSGLLSPYLADSVVDPVRDLGPIIDLQLKLDGRTMSLDLKSQRVSASAAGELSTDGMVVVCSRSVVTAQLSPLLLEPLIGVRPSEDWPVTFNSTRLQLPISPFDLGSVGVSGELTLPAAALRIGSANDEFRMGRTTVSATGDSIGTGLQLRVATAIQGTTANLNGRLQVGSADSSSASFEGKLTTGPVDLSTIHALDEGTVRLLSGLGLDGMSVALELSGATQRGSAKIAAQNASTSINFTIGWDKASVQLSATDARMLLTPEAMKELTGGTIVLGEQVPLKLLMDPLTRSRDAIERSGLLPDQIKCALQADEMILRSVPHLSGQFTARDLRGVVTIGVTAGEIDAKMTFAGTAAAAAAGSTASATADDWRTTYSGKALWSFGATSGAASTPMQSVTAQVTIGPGESAIAAALGAGSAGAMLTGPGTITVACQFAPNLTINSTLSLPRVKGAIALGVKQAGQLAIAPTTLTLMAPLAVMESALAGDVTGVRAAMGGSSKNAGVDVPIKVTLRSFNLREGLGASEIDADLQIGAFGNEKRRLGLTNLSVRGAPLESALSIKGSTVLTLGKAAGMPVQLDASLLGELGMLLGRDEPLQLRNSRIRVECPGEFAEVIANLIDNDPVPSAAGNTRADPVLAVSTIDLTLTVNSLTLPMRLADATIDASLSLAPCTARVDKAESIRIGALTAQMKSPSTIGTRLDVAIDGSIEPTAGAASTISAKFGAKSMGQADGTLAPSAASIGGTLDFVSFPLALADALANDSGALTEVLGDTVTLHVSAVETAGGSSAVGASTASRTQTSVIAATLITPYLALSAPKVTLAAGVASIRPEAPLTASLTLNDTIRQELLAPMNPLLADVEDAPPLRLTVDSLDCRLDGDMSRLNGHLRMEVGDVTIVKSNQVLGLLSIVQKSTTRTVPAHIDPLDVTVTAGKLKYSDWGVYAGKTGTQWSVELALSGDIDLARKPVWANAITCTYPLDSLARSIANALPGQRVSDEISNILSMTPAALLDMLKVQVIFSGPLGQVDGKDVPLQMKMGATVGNPLESAGKLLDRIGNLFGGK